MTDKQLRERRADGRLRRWHARMGIIAAAFLLFLLVSGILLNHTASLKLDSTAVRNALLMKWYGLETIIPEAGFQVGDGYLVVGADKWMLIDRVIAEKQPMPVGAIELNGVTYVATRSVLYLYQPSGLMIDKVDQASLPAVPVERLGKLGREVVIGTPRGEYRSDDGLNWRPSAEADAKWSRLVGLPQEVRQALAGEFAASVPLERVLLDLHSGRLFGRYGPLVIDLAAVCLAGLVLTGVWFYTRTRWRRRELSDK